LALEQGQMALLFETEEAQRRIHEFVQRRRSSGPRGPVVER
jgi:hypothetical protein